MKKIIFLIATFLTCFMLMAGSTDITITHPETKAQLEAILYGTENKVMGAQLERYFRALNSGARSATVEIQVGQGDYVFATGSIAVAAGNASEGDYVTIGNTRFTAVGTGSTPVAGEFALGSTATQTASRMSQALNSYASINQWLTATSSGSTVTLTSQEKGTMGNLVILGESTNTVRMSCSGSYMSGGVDGTINSFSFGY